jgi:hypothetical protein
MSNFDDSNVETGSSANGRVPWSWVALAALLAVVLGVVFGEWSQPSYWFRIP